MKPVDFAVSSNDSFNGRVKEQLKERAEIGRIRRL